MKWKNAKNLIITMPLAVLMIMGTVVTGMASGSPNVVKVGVVIPLSGPLASIGTHAQRGVIMAVERINKNGGIKALNGAKIELIFGDDEGKPDVAMAEAERLITREKVDALMGPYTSSCAFPMTQVSERYKVPHMVPTSSKDEITERGFTYIFRLTLKGTKIAREQYDFIKWLQKKTNVQVNTVALLYEDSGWGQSWSGDARKLAPEYGYKLVADLSYSKDTKDVRSTLLKLKAANPDFVLQESYTMDAILITKTLHELQYYPKGIIGTGTGHSDVDYFKGTGKLKEYMIQWEGWNPAVPIAEGKVRAEEYRKRYGETIDVYVAFWYSSMYSLAKAIEQAGSVDKQKVRDALHKVNLDVNETGNLNIFPVRYDESGQAPSTGVVTQWINGVMEVIYPEGGATAKPVFPVPKWENR